MDLPSVIRRWHFRQGIPIREIRRRTGLSRNTIRKYLRDAPKKQKTRMLKCECATCGYTVRTARKWLELAGAPLCPIEDHGRMQHEPLGDETEGEDGE